MVIPSVLENDDLSWCFGRNKLTSQLHFHELCFWMASTGVKPGINHWSNVFKLREPCNLPSTLTTTSAWCRPPLLPALQSQTKDQKRYSREGETNAHSSVAV